MKKLWEKIVEELGKEEIEKLGEKINYSIEDIGEVNLEEFLSKANLYLMLYDNKDNDVEKVLPVREKTEILEEMEKVSARASDVKEFVERRRRRAAEKKRMNQRKVVSP